MQDHLLAEVQLLDLPHVSLPRGIELPRHDQPVPRTAEPRPCVQQDIQPLVVADQPEEERIALRRIEPQTAARLVARDGRTEILEQRMRRKERRSGGIGLQLLVHLFRHVDEPVDRREEIAVERTVDEVVFVRLDVVDLADRARVAVAARQTGDRPEAGCHEGRPVFHQHEIGTFAANGAPHAPPVEGVDRVDAAFDVQIGGRRRGDRLALAWKKERRILHREGLDPDVVASRSERAGHDLHDRGQPSPVGMRRAYDADLHGCVRAL